MAFAIGGALAASPAVAMESRTRSAFDRTAVRALLEGHGCDEVNGYAEAKRKLLGAVRARDPRALQRLLHPDGSMRINGIHLTPGSLTTEPESPRWSQVWASLSMILRSGCARSGERLILPGFARLAEAGIDTDFAIVIRPTFLRSSPQLHAQRMSPLSTGRLVTVHEEPAPDGWAIAYWNGRRGFIRADDLANPYGYRIELERLGDRWMIVEIGTGI